MNEPPQLADPAVSHAKFQHELAEFDSLRSEYARRGWFLVRAEFPEVLVLLAAPQLKPAPVVTGVLFNYADYDLRPPSVRLVNPFSDEPYVAADLPTNLLRQVEVDGAVQGFVGPPGMPPPKFIQQQPLMQAYADELPFLCLAGVREYHDHPAHSGDRWELHRRAGAGRLVRILEIIDTYGVRPLNGYAVGLVPTVTGFTQGEVPA